MMLPIDNSSFGEENERREPDDSQFSSSPDSSSLPGACENDGRSIQDVWADLRAGADTDAQLAEGSPAERARQQAVLIALEQTGWKVLDAAIQALRILSNKTSEHDVRFASAKCVLKTTWPGWYGQVPIVLDGKLRRATATPAQYLDRLNLHNTVFNGKIKLIGFCVSDRPSLVIGEPPGLPSIVVSQPLYGAADPRHPNPTLQMVAEFMRAQGFLLVRDAYFGWVRLDDGVVVTDAKPDNFVFTEAGIVPIDLQIAQLDPVLVRQIVVV